MHAGGMRPRLAVHLRPKPGRLFVTLACLSRSHTVGATKSSEMRAKMRADRNSSSIQKPGTASAVAAPLSWEIAAAAAGQGACCGLWPEAAPLWSSWLLVWLKGRSVLTAGARRSVGCTW